MKKGLDEMIDEVVLWWFDHVERIVYVYDRVYVGKCAGSRLVGRPRKR